VVAEYASFDFLLWPEKAVLDELRPQLGSARMLDLGVGAGRTTLHFSDAVRDYVGIDISPKMIDACRRRFADGAVSNVAFLVSDVRHLDAMEASSFDFVLFSFNGMDTVGGHDDRLAALNEIHRVCRPGGRFCFSTHNLSFALAHFSTTTALRAQIRTQPRAAIKHPRSLARAVTESRRWAALNPARRQLARQGYGMIVEERYRFEFGEEFYASARDRIQVQKYYIRPEEQIAQLRLAGFEQVRILAPDGAEVTDRVSDGLSQYWWLYYLTKKSG
jgi:ubiquinone/menaquinone biosynthesis C-methylase UbiE